MIYLLWGDDQYRIDKRINEIKDSVGQNLDLNLVQINDNFDFPKIKAEIETMPFLSNKKVVVLRDSLGSKSKEFSKRLFEFLPTVSESCDLVLVEGEQPKNLKSVEKYIKIEPYQSLRPFEVTTWIKKKVIELGGKIPEKNAETLSLMLGNDLIRIENEIKKLITYNPEVSEESINELVTAEFSDSIFNLIDAVSEKNPKKALKLLNKFLENEENENYILSMLARQVRNLLIIKELAGQGKNESQIVSETGLHPFVVKKTLAQSRNFSQDKLLSMHQTLVKTDLAFKSSGSEPLLVLNRLIIDFIN